MCSVYSVECSDIKCGKDSLSHKILSSIATSPFFFLTKLKLEAFKFDQKEEHALHSKYNVVSGDLSPDAHHQLQLDAVAIFVLYLVQMISSGLQVGLLLIHLGAIAKSDRRCQHGSALLHLTDQLSAETS